MTELVSVGNLQILIRRSARRRTVNLSVERDGTLVASAPPTLDIRDLTRFIRGKELWFHKALLRKEVMGTEAPPKQFVQGEGFYYLGRLHRLRIVDSHRHPPLRLFEGKFYLERASVAKARELFVSWYSAHLQNWLAVKLPRLQERVGVRVCQTRVMDLGYRWASCSASGSLNLHWRIVLMPPTVTTYLVLHELCHLIEHNHTDRFWAVVRRVDHDFERKEEWLRKHGAMYTL
jgi:hypothetical protein